MTGRWELAWAIIRVRFEICGRGRVVAGCVSVAEILDVSCFGRFRFGIHLRTGFSVVVVVALPREYCLPLGFLCVEEVV